LKRNFSGTHLSIFFGTANALRMHPLQCAIFGLQGLRKGYLGLRREYNQRMHPEIGLPCRHCPIQELGFEKARDRFPGAGLESCDALNMPVICPTCQISEAGGSFVRSTYSRP
jgi:hypothetical protein